MLIIASAMFFSRLGEQIADVTAPIFTPSFRTDRKTSLDPVQFERRGIFSNNLEMVIENLRHVFFEVRAKDKLP